MRARPWIGVVGLAVALTACGRGGSDVPAGATARLDPLTAAVRSAVRHNDRVAATGALARLTDTVASLRANDELSSTAASRIESAAARVAQQIDVFLTTTSSTTTTTEPSSDSKNQKHDHQNNGDHGD